MKNILEGKIESRINAYVLLKELNSEHKFRDIEKIQYFDFEENGYSFFKENNLTLNVFDRGKLFQYIKNIEVSQNKILLVDNLEIIQNILFEKDEFEEFLREMQLQKFRNKVIFVFSNIRVMKLEKLLKDNYPEKNIVVGV
ncbi:MAG: hypothetical protein ACRCZ9_02700 [Fusobacteriaceae bacterium]